jgi:hypothetical protein
VEEKCGFRAHFMKVAAERRSPGRIDNPLAPLYQR